MGESKEVINKILLSVEHAYYAISNKGNELYIFGEELIDKTKNLNIFITILIVLIGCIALLITKKIKKHFNYLLIYILPISFIICSSVFATRIGAHHFGVITPLIGVILGISINNIIEIDQVKLSKEFKVIVSIIFVIIIGLNLISYNEFNEKLEKTGGVKMFSEEIDKMALDAKENPNESVYYFIDWGFMMPFMFITENNVPYFTDLNQDTIQYALENNKSLKICYWNEEDQYKYIDILNQYGIIEISIEAKYQRDGKIAFWIMEGAIH